MSEASLKKHLELVRIVGGAKGLMRSMTQCADIGACMQDHVVKNTIQAMKDWMEKEEKFFKITNGDDK